MNGYFSLTGMRFLDRKLAVFEVTFFFFLYLMARILNCSKQNFFGFKRQHNSIFTAIVIYTDFYRKNSSMHKKAELKVANYLFVNDK